MYDRFVKEKKEKVMSQMGNHTDRNSGDALDREIHSHETKKH